MSSSMWAPSNAQELDAARQTPRKTPFAEQHAKAREQGFWAPDAPSGSGSGGRRTKSGPGRSRKPGGMDAPTPDRGGGRASGRGKPQFHQEPIAMTTTPIKQTASSAGFGRKTSKDREAIWQSIWGDDSDEEKPKGKSGEEKEQAKGKEAVPSGKQKESAGTDKDVQQLGDKLKTTEITAKAAPVSQPRPAPPTVVIPPPAVISGVDWSELDDDEDLTFLEQVPVPVASAVVSTGGRQTSEREAITTSSSTPSVSTGRSTANLGDEQATVADGPSGLDVTTASDIADSSYENPPQVNVGRRASASPSSPPNETKDGQATVDVKLAPQVPTPTPREQAQTSMDIGSEGESGTPTTDSSRAGLKGPVQSTRTTDGSDLKNSRWAGPNTRGMANPRGARGGGRVPVSQGPFRQGPPAQRNQPFHNGPPRPMMQNGPRPPVAPANRAPPTGSRATPMPQSQTAQNQHRGSGSRNAPPLAAHQSAQQPNSAVPSTKGSGTSSPVPPSNASGVSSTTDSPSSTPLTNTPAQQQQQQQQQRGPRQAPMPKDAAKRLMHGWIGTAPGGMRRGPSGRGRGRAPVGGGGGQAVNTATPSKDVTQ